MTGPGLARRHDRVRCSTARSRRALCEHPAAGFPPGRDWRGVFKASLRAFSPDAEDRAAYQAEQEALAATPPCPRCGWCPEPIFVRVAEGWGQHGPSDGDGVA